MQPMPNQMGPEEIFWYKDQVAFTFRSPLNTTAGKQGIINALPLGQLNDFLRQRHQVTLRSFGPDEVPQGQASKGLNQFSSTPSRSLADTTAKYLFPSPDGQGSVVVGFFHIDAANADTDHTPDVVNSINKGEFTAEGVQALTTMPNWLSACTGDVGHGCPLTPPVEVDATDSCAASPGRWPITVPQLPPELTEANGEGVTVLVLDAFPKIETITAALSKVPSGDNILLQDMATGMVEIESPFTPKPPATNIAPAPAISIYHQSLPDPIELPGDHQPMTGKDIDGNPIGYPMADHGLFVTGTIRTLAPAAKIVCVRVLNDFGAGDTVAIIQTLETIANHVGRDLHLPLVINMSMVVTPYDEQLPCLGLERDLSPSVREGLRVPLQAMAKLGVIVVAAAGNDSDPRKGSRMKCMEMVDGMRLGPRYPAAFADTIPQVIPVGAIDKDGNPAPYSDYPGANGVATYGGGLLERDETNSQPGHTRAMEPIDGLRGVYTAPYYPALSQDDTNTSLTEPVKFDYPEIDALNNNAWAYWSGTSFATPIIAGLTALVLQAEAPASDNVRQMVIAIAGANTVTWTGLDPVVPGPVICVQQCATETISE